MGTTTASDLRMYSDYCYRRPLKLKYDQIGFPTNQPTNQPNQPNQPTMAGSKKSSSSTSRAGKNAKKTPAFSPANHGLMTVDREYPLSGLLLQVTEGEYKWAPVSAIGMVGTIDNFAPRVGQPSKTAEKWTSGWIAVDDFVIFGMRAFGKDPPSGFWRVESAGLRAWETDLAGNPDEPDLTAADKKHGRVGVKHARALRREIAAHAAAADSDDDDE